VQLAAGSGLRELCDFRGGQKGISVDSFEAHFSHFPNPNQPKLAFVVAHANVDRVPDAHAPPNALDDDAVGAQACDHRRQRESLTESVYSPNVHRQLNPDPCISAPIHAAPSRLEEILI